MFKELEFVLKYISQQIETHQLIQLYRELAQLFELARSTPSEETTQNINNTKEKIRQTQESIQPRDWDVIKLRLFRDFGSEQYLGNEGYNILEEYLAQTANDPGGASQKSQTLASEIEALKQRAEQVLNGLESLFSKQTEETFEGKEKIQLVFDGKVSVENLDDLEAQAKDWDAILKMVRFLSPNGQEEAIVYRIYKSSPTIIVIVAAAPLVLALAKLVKDSLEIVEKLYQIRKAQLEIESLDLDIEIKQTTLDNLQRGEQKELDTLVSGKVAEYMKDYKSKLKSEDLGTAENVVSINIKKIYNFTVSGGNVNLADGEIKVDNETIKQSEFSPIYEKVKGIIERKERPLLVANITEQEKKEVEKLAEPSSPVENSISKSPKSKPKNKTTKS